MSKPKAESIQRAFGAENRARLLDAYFHRSSEVTPENAWEHIYRLLLWIDRTTGLAHCYESDKSQPGRPWYARSLRFHDWVSQQLQATPRDLGLEIDWLFREAAKDLAKAASQDRVRLAKKQRGLYEGRDFPEPGQDPDLVALICETLAPWLQEEPPGSVLQDLSEKIYEHLRLENKRKNLVGEGFEDVLAGVIRRLPGAEGLDLRTREPLHQISGFYETPDREKTKKVDLACIKGIDRSLITVKWSIRADREEQFQSDFNAYTRLERAGRPVDYVLVTNEFDPARLKAACERQNRGNNLFDSVVHVNTDALLVTYGKNHSRSATTVVDHIQAGRLMSLSGWLQSLVD